jgi:general secretion pathway protein D
MVLALQFGNWLLAESPTEGACTNEISEVIPIKYELASDVAAALNAEESGHGGNWVHRALVAPAEITNLYAQVQALGRRGITWDERSNSLVVTTSSSDMPKIKEIISKLDVVLAQVLIEGVVLQFPFEERRGSRRLAADGASGLPPCFMALTNVVVLSTSRFTSVDAGGKTNTPGSQLSYEATLTGDLDALVTSLANSQPVRILQRPRIRTSVGVPATMFAGWGRPYPSGAYTCGCVPSISPSDPSGITIEVTCMLTTDGTVLTDIQEKVDRFVRNVTIQNVGDVPVTESYSAQAHLAVRDREIIALGGLIQAAKRPIFSEVEALDKVPLAGHLLNRIITSPTHTKRYELMVLIRPIVLPAPEMKTLAAKRDDRMPGIESLEKQMHEDDVERFRAAEPDPTAKHD